MKKILIIFALLFSVIATAQQYHDKGAKFENATSVGDTISNNTRIPIIDEFGLVNYYVDVADLLALNPAPVLEWGNITGTLSNQTDLQGALNNKADQSDLTAHTSNGNIHFTQSAISITESQVSDLKDYLRGDINDTNGANKLTLGSLEVTGQTILQNGLNMTSIPVGTSDNILTLNQTTGDVEQRVFSLGDIDIANAAGTNQFPVGLGEQLRFEGSGDTSISFNGVTNTVTITSVPGSGGGGAVTTFNGRDGAVVSQAGDYSTAMVNENTNLYFTEPRVRATPLTGLTVTNTPISSTNTFLQALGRLQGQINDRLTTSASDGRYLLVSGNTTKTSGNLIFNDNARAYFGTDSDMRVFHNNGLNYIQLFSGDFIIRDAFNAVDRFYFQRETGNLTTTGRAVLGNYIQVSGAGNNIRSTGSGTGASNINYITLNESDGSTTQGLIGFISNTNNHLYISNSVTGKTLLLQQDGDMSYNGSFSATGTITGSNLSGTNTGDQTLSGLGGEPAFSKNTAFNKNFGTASGTVAQGNDSRINNGQTAFSWGNHASAGYAKMNTTNTGSITFTGDVIANSDKRLKKNIKRIDNALAIVQLLGGYEYDRKDVDLHQAGVIAQEVEEVFPVAVSEDANGTKSVAYNHLIALLIEAVKEQQIEIEQLKTMINEK